jgi:hypothetical protein
MIPYFRLLVGPNLGRVTRRFEKNWPNLSKSLQGQNAKIFTTKLNLKAQNFYIKPLLNLKINIINHVLKPLI